MNALAATFRTPMQKDMGDRWSSVVRRRDCAWTISSARRKPSSSVLLRRLCVRASAGVGEGAGASEKRVDISRARASATRGGATARGRDCVAFTLQPLGNTCLISRLISS